MDKGQYYHVDVFSDTPLSGNGLTVFTQAGGLSKEIMQKLTQEMRQFESIFLQMISQNRVRAYVFTCEEELDFAGHPILGAAAVLHDLFNPEDNKAEWVFELNKKTVTVQTESNGGTYNALMNQGRAEFGRVLNQAETVSILKTLNLEIGDLYPGHFPVVISTGLPYLIIPLINNALKAKIVVHDFEARLFEFGAKFAGTLEIPTLSMRTWDNDGSVEDIATGSLAGPCGAYLVSHNLEKTNSIIQLNQGGNLNRPSKLFAEVTSNDKGKFGDVFVGGAVCKVAEGVIAQEVFEKI